MTLSLTTISGTESLQASATSGQWHSLAVRVSDDVMQLYVDGRIYRQPLSGSITPANGSITLGGLKAVMRSFRVYDYNSQPLITFADGSTERILESTTETLTLKSLGNLGKAVSDSQLKSLRVALISGTERNYASLLSKIGYQDIALQYLYTVSPQQPVAAAYNPLGFIIPSAHAWSWDGVWEGVKTTVSVFIPYEDFITIGEQMIYLVNRDWKNFDPTTLAFASLGAATIIPLARPLEPLLGPLKKVVDGMKKFPGARHFAGAIGTSVQSALSGKTDKLANLMPFLLVAVELYDDPEVFGFIMNAIESEDDLWTWISYIAMFVEQEGGFDSFAYTDHQPQNGLPLSFMFNQAYAKSRADVAKQVIGILKVSAKKVDDPKQFVKGLKEVIDELLDPANANWRKAILSGNTLRYMTTLGGAKLRAFLRSSKNWRVNRWVVLFSVVYLAEEQAEGRLNISADKWTKLAADVFSERPWVQHGAMFQLSQMVYYHLNTRFNDGPAIVDIEATRPAYLLINSEYSDGLTPYNRRIDIVLDSGDGGETWVEIKSIAGPFLDQWFTPTLSATKSSGGLYDSKTERAYYRQFFHDMRLNRAVISLRNEPEILRRTGKSNHQYRWYFHEFKDTSGSKSPAAADITKARGLLCAKPNISNINRVYELNFNDTASSVQNQCNNDAKDLLRGTIVLRNTRSYFTEILEKYASELDIEDMVDMAKTIGVD